MHTLVSLINKWLLMKPRVSQDFSLSGGHGNQIPLKNKGSIGYNFATSYSNTTKYYSEAEFGDYGMKENVDSVGLNLRNNQVGELEQIVFY